MISEVIFDVFLMDACAKLPQEKHRFILVFPVWEAQRHFRKNDKIHVFLHFSGDFFRKGRRLRFFIDSGSILAPIWDQLGTKVGKKGSKKHFEKKV